METANFKITNTGGLHSAIAAKIVNASSKFSSHIELQYKDKTISAKSILGIMSLAIPQGNDVLLVAVGDDAKDAIDYILTIFN